MTPDHSIINKVVIMFCQCCQFRRKLSCSQQYFYVALCVISPLALNWKFSQFDLDFWYCILYVYWGLRPSLHKYDIKDGVLAKSFPSYITTSTRNESCRNQINLHRNGWPIYVMYIVLLITFEGHWVFCIIQVDGTTRYSLEINAWAVHWQWSIAYKSFMWPQRPKETQVQPSQ